jgi:hypothetical protein
MGQYLSAGDGIRWAWFKVSFAAQTSIFHWLYQMSKYWLSALISFNITDSRAAGKLKYVIRSYFCVTLNQAAQQTKICGHLF